MLVLCDVDISPMEESPLNDAIFYVEIEIEAKLHVHRFDERADLKIVRLACALRCKKKLKSRHICDHSSNSGGRTSKS